MPSNLNRVMHLEQNNFFQNWKIMITHVLSKHVFCIVFLNNSFHTENRKKPGQLYSSAMCIPLWVEVCNVLGFVFCFHCTCLKIWYWFPHSLLTEGELYSESVETKTFASSRKQSLKLLIEWFWTQFRSLLTQKFIRTKLLSFNTFCYRHEKWRKKIFPVSWPTAIQKTEITLYTSSLPLFYFLLCPGHAKICAHDVAPGLFFDVCVLHSSNWREDILFGETVKENAQHFWRWSIAENDTT